MLLDLEPREQEKRNDSDRDELHTTDRLHILARPGHRPGSITAAVPSYQVAQAPQQIEYARADPHHTQQPEPGTDEEPRAGTPEPSPASPSVAGKTCEKQRANALAVEGEDEPGGDQHGRQTDPEPCSRAVVRKKQVGVEDDEDERDHAEPPGRVDSSRTSRRDGGRRRGHATGRSPAAPSPEHQIPADPAPR